MALCGATLDVGDDYGDNSSTFHCQLPYEHEGKHQAILRKGDVVITWTGDDRTECLCGHEEFQHYVTFISDEKDIVLEKIRGGCLEGGNDRDMILENGRKEPPKSEGQCLCQKYERYTGPRRGKKSSGDL
jgi:hypothetical protein